MKQVYYSKKDDSGPGETQSIPLASYIILRGWTEYKLVKGLDNLVKFIFPDLTQRDIEELYQEYSKTENRQLIYIQKGLISKIRALQNG